MVRDGVVRLGLRYAAGFREETGARIEAVVEITDRTQLERILKNIKRISGVLAVERVYRV